VLLVARALADDGPGNGIEGSPVCGDDESYEETNNSTVLAYRQSNSMKYRAQRIRDLCTGENATGTVLYVGRQFYSRKARQLTGMSGCEDLSINEHGMEEVAVVVRDDFVHRIVSPDLVVVRRRAAAASQRTTRWCGLI
jgi:hypothetical protein